VPRADNLTTFMCRMSEIWEPQRSRTLWACTEVALPVFYLIMWNIILLCTYR